MLTWGFGCAWALRYSYSRRTADLDPSLEVRRGGPAEIGAMVLTIAAICGALAVYM
jgi:hypothetical protein